MSLLRLVTGLAAVASLAACTGILMPSGGFALTEYTRATVSPNGLGTMTCAYSKP